MAGAGRNKDKETKELYINFDRAFLNIYPGFVSSLNALLKEEERFELRKGELLNTELRVFALIRLGITDSGKIADFLRCSLQTVYNYRSKIKRKSLREEEDIEEQIKKIGMVKQLSFDFWPVPDRNRSWSCQLEDLFFLLSSSAWSIRSSRPVCPATEVFSSARRIR